MSAEERDVSAATPAVTAPAEAAVPAAVAAPLPVSVPTSAPASAPAPTVALPRMGVALTRLQELAGQLVPRLQYQVMRLGVAGQVGIATLAAAAAAAVGVLLPAWQAVQTLNADIARAQHGTAATSVEQAGPHLLASLPTRAQIPVVLGQVFAEAKTAGVPLDSGRYVYSPAKSGAVAHYDIEFPVKQVSYPALRTFIDRTLTVVPAASLEKLHVERKAVGDQTVNADVGFVVYLRGGESP